MGWVSFEEHPTFLQSLKISLGSPKLELTESISSVGTGVSGRRHPGCSDVGPRETQRCPARPREPCHRLAGPSTRPSGARGTARGSATGGLGPVAPPRPEPTYPGAPGRRPPARAAGPGAAGGGRLRAGPACWLSLLPAGDPERRRAALARPRCPRAARGSAQVKGARCGAGAGPVRAGVHGCRRGRRWRPGVARSWCAGCCAGRPGPALYGPAGPREEGEGRGWGGPLGWASPLPGRGGGRSEELGGGEGGVSGETCRSPGPSGSSAGRGGPGDPQGLGTGSKGRAAGRQGVRRGAQDRVEMKEQRGRKGEERTPTPRSGHRQAPRRLYSFRLRTWFGQTFKAHLGFPSERTLKALQELSPLKCSREQSVSSVPSSFLLNTSSAGRLSQLVRRPEQ